MQECQRLLPSVGSCCWMMEHSRVMVVKRVVCALVHMEFRIGATPKRLPHRVSLLRCDVLVRIAKLEKHGTAHAVRFVEGAGEGEP